jgi:Flp pilus assembly protein TadG
MPTKTLNRASHAGAATTTAAAADVRRRGTVLLYVIVSMTVMLLFVSIAVDFGHVQLAKTQLQSACDASARYAAMGLKNILDGESAAGNNAALAAKENSVDGSPVVVDASKDVQMVVWNAASKTYTVTSDPTAANAVRVTMSRSAARGNPIPLIFSRIVGRNTCDINASSVAMLKPGAAMTYDVPATSNPFLAGMPTGSVASVNNPHNSPDYAPYQSPVATAISVTPNTTMTFDGISGQATNDKNDTNRYTADGNEKKMQTNTAGNENGIANMTGPLNCLVGLFLDDNKPSLTQAPHIDTQACPDNYTTDQSRDRQNYAPALKQIFFIGDGRTGDGDVQQFKVPPGATRLYIATWDSYEWNNNTGSFSVTVHRPGTVLIVK